MGWLTTKREEVLADGTKVITRNHINNDVNMSNKNGDNIVVERVNSGTALVRSGSSASLGFDFDLMNLIQAQK